MIISRKEFHRRFGLTKMKVIKKQEEFMSVDRLYKEIMADAPFRNHNYMFEGDYRKLELQEENEGISIKFPDIKTEGERFDKIKEEIIKDTYESVPVLRDIDYPDVIYVDNGFHRIFIAHQLGHKTIRVKASYGKFTLANNISFGELDQLLDMLKGLFKPKTTLEKLHEQIKEILAKNPKAKDWISIGYGSFSIGNEGVKK